MTCFPARLGRLLGQGLYLFCQRSPWLQHGGGGGLAGRRSLAPVCWMPGRMDGWTGGRSRPGVCVHMRSGEPAHRPGAVTGAYLFPHRRAALTFGEPRRLARSAIAVPPTFVGIPPRGASSAPLGRRHRARRTEASGRTRAFGSRAPAGICPIVRREPQ